MRHITIALLLCTMLMSCASTPDVAKKPDPAEQSKSLKKGITKPVVLKKMPQPKLLSHHVQMGELGAINFNLQTDERLFKLGRGFSKRSGGALFQAGSFCHALFGTDPEVAKGIKEHPTFLLSPKEATERGALGLTAIVRGYIQLSESDLFPGYLQTGQWTPREFFLTVITWLHEGDHAAKRIQHVQRLIRAQTLFHRIQRQALEEARVYGNELVWITVIRKHLKHLATTEELRARSEKVLNSLELKAHRDGTQAFLCANYAQMGELIHLGYNFDKLVDNPLQKIHGVKIAELFQSMSRLLKLDRGIGALPDPKERLYIVTSLKEVRLVLKPKYKTAIDKLIKENHMLTLRLERLKMHCKQADRELEKVD